MQRALESAIAELTLGPPIAPEDSAAIAAWLARHELTGDDARALTRDFARLLVCRTLVRRNLRDALVSTIPRSIARLGPRFDADFAEFLRASPPVTRLLKDVTPRFLAFALPRWQSDPTVPPYLPDLARHEALQIEVATLLARPKENVLAELGLDDPVEFIDAARLVHYDWAVHRLPEDETSRVVPERARVSLLAYRSPEHEVRYLELGPFAAELLSRLLVGRQSLRLALTGAAAQLELRLDSELLEASARLLSELAERGALLGKTPTDLA